MDLPAQIPDDDACLEFLWRRAFSEDGQTARCPSCHGLRRFYRVAGRPSYRCTSCGHYIHPTAGTIFHKSRTPLKVWFRAVQLVGADGGPPVSELGRQLGVSYQTARRMVRLIRAGVAPEPSVASLSGTIWTFAGDGTCGYGGDGLPASAAQLAAPYDVAADEHGNVFIADTQNHVVRRVDPAGIISTVAGTGTPGYTGDGGPATNAQLHGPVGVSVDDDDSLLIADTYNHAVRRVDAEGRITTIAGTGAAGFSGDGGAATAAAFDRPARVLLAGGRCLISDQRNGRIRAVDTSGTITTLAAGLVMPRGMASDVAGNVYVAQAASIDVPAHSVVKIDLSGGATAFAGLGPAGSSGDGGPARAALLGKPGDVLVDRDGNVLICEHYNNRVRRVDASGVITTIVGTGRPGFGGNGGPAGAARLNNPVALALTPAGDLLIADNENHRIRKVTAPFA